MSSTTRKRVLVTGGAGLIGSHIVDLLVDGRDRGTYGEIVILDNFVRGRRENLASALERGPLTLVEGDITDRTTVADVMAGIDVVFHLAALRITQCAEDPRLAVDVLGNGTFNILEAAVKSGVRKVVASSTASVYGLAEVFPTTEQHHPYNNRTIYGATKVFNEGLLRSFNEMYQLPYVALRYFNVYGPRQDPASPYAAAIPRFVQALRDGRRPTVFGDGLQTRDFVFVGDIVQALWAAAHAPGAAGGIFNVGRGEETTILDLIGTIANVLGVPAEIDFQPARPGEVRHSRADVSRLTTQVGFRAATDLPTGLAMTLHE